MYQWYNVALVLVLGMSLLLVYQGFICVYEPVPTLPDSGTLSNTSIDHLISLSDVDNIFNTELPPILVPRVPDTPSHTRVRDHIISQLRGLGESWEVTLHQFSDETPFGKKNFTNIIATLHPDIEVRMVLAAHYDSKVLAGGEFLGAIDSALPCALLIDLVKSLNSLLKSAISSSSSETIQLVFFDGEEAFREWSAYDSIYGARRLSAEFESGSLLKTGSGKSALEAISGLVLLDLLGASNSVVYQYPQTTATELYSLMRRAEASLKKRQVIPRHLTYFSEQRRQSYIEDDHVPFLRKGVRVLHAIPTPFPAVWHTLRDDLSALDRSTVKHLQKLFQLFVCSKFNLISF